MKCEECQQYHREHAGEDLPEAVAAHLLECAACRKARHREAALLQLLQIKRHEQPDAAFEVRNLARVRAAIAELPAPRGWWAALGDLLAGRAIPAFRYAAALLVLGLFGLNWLSVRSLPPLPTASLDAVRPAQPVSLVAAPTDAPLSPGGDQWAPAIFITSNQQPWRLEGGGPQYGTKSRLAGFEF